MDVAALKKKVSEEFITLLCKTGKGYRLNYEFLLEEISLIEQKDEIDNKLLLTAIQYYLNNQWQITQS